MSYASVRHQICTYFGGEYNADARAYLDPQVAGLGVVKRARGKRTNKRELHGGMDTDTHGTAMLVHLQTGRERRVAFAGATSGIKQVTTEAVLHVFLHSSARLAEDAQDAFYDLQEAILQRIRADRTLGSGGFEGRLPDGEQGFQVGEGEGEGITWEMDPVETTSGITRGYLVIAFDVDHYIHA